MPGTKQSDHDADHARDHQENNPIDWQKLSVHFLRIVDREKFPEKDPRDNAHGRTPSGHVDEEKDELLVVVMTNAGSEPGTMMTVPFSKSIDGHVKGSYSISTINR